MVDFIFTRAGLSFFSGGVRMISSTGIKLNIFFRLSLLAAFGLFLHCFIPAAKAQTQRIVIVNQAADGIVNYVSHKVDKPFGKGATKDMVFAALDSMVDQYEGTGVSHVFWNVNYQRVAYDSKAWPSYWDYPDPEKNVTEWPRSYYELHKLGVDDVFSRLIPRCRTRGISPWISLRMNDHHYTKDPSRVSPLFFEHPELRTRGGNGLFNYARPEVRDHYMKLIVEVMQRYDIDGVELDWIRTPSNFNDTELESGRGILSDFVCEVHRHALEAASRLGHPVKVAVRVPTTPEFAYGKGFDAVAWARDGLVDMIIPSDWWDGCADAPVEEWRRQIGTNGKNCMIVPATAGTYACVRKKFMMSLNIAAMRGFAAQVLDRGADGVYLFNHFHAVTTNIRTRTPEGKMTNDCTLAELIRAAGDLAGAVNNPRLHVLGMHDCVPSDGSYVPSLPAVVTSLKPATFRIHTGPQPSRGRCVIHIGLDKSDDIASARLAARFNGSDCRQLADLPVPAKPEPRLELPRINICEVAPRVVQFEVPVAAVTRGYNTVELSTVQGGPQTIIWVEVCIEP